ncbi:MAG: M48 family metallopeptidase [Deltaproteobacteria bacterium]
MNAANEVIKHTLNYFCRIIKLNYNIMRIKEQKTRWGSCSKKDNLNFNKKAQKWLKKNGVGLRL